MGSVHNVETATTALEPLGISKDDGPTVAIRNNVGGGRKIRTITGRSSTRDPASTNPPRKGRSILSSMR
jgi:hypothetical protein